MADPIGQPLGPIFTPAPNAKPTKPPTVEASCRRCLKPQVEHEPTNGINAAYSMEDSSNDSIPSIPRPSTPSGSSSAPPSDTPRKLSSSNGVVETPQDRRKEQIGTEINGLREELCSNCFFSSFLPEFREDVHGKILDSLPLLTEKPFKLTSPMSPTRKIWPNSSNEKVYYPHLTHLLNEILNHSIGIVNPNNNERVQFITYDRQMAPVTPKSLKLDLLLVEDQFVDLPSLYWTQPIVPIEVKSDFWDALKQLGTYAREMLSARPGRQVCWGFYFNHSNSSMRIILFTPDRVDYTQPTVITSAAGYRQMAKTIVALLSKLDLLTLGEDRSRDSSTKLLPNNDRLKIQKVEFDRKSLVGRKTRVLSVVVVGGDGGAVQPTISEHGQTPANVRQSDSLNPPPLSLNRIVFTKQAPTGPSSVTATRSSSRRPRTKSVVATPEGQGPASSPSAAGPSSYRKHFTRSVVASLDQNQPASGVMSSPRPNTQEGTSNLMADYILKDLCKNPDETITFAGDHKHLTIGDHLVIKESWPLLSREDIEWEALISCAGQFGVPEVVYRVVGKHPMPVKYAQPAARVPQHIALKEKGVRLHLAKSPRTLLTAITHAIIGHFNLFQQGWLHRDVSIGNVLMLWEPVTKLPPDGLEWLGNLTECQGMLIDGDAMIHSSLGREPGSHRSCTPPFLSRRLVTAWELGIETFDQYFDDLESFAWVLLWALLEIAEMNKTATTFDRLLMKRLNGSNLESLKTGKDSIAGELSTLSGDIAHGLPKVCPTSLLDPFIEILDHWFSLIKTKERCGNAGTLPSSEGSTLFYKSFISFAMDQKLPDAWPPQEQSDAP